MAMSGRGFGVAGPADALLVQSLAEAVPVALQELLELPADARRKQAIEWYAGAAKQLETYGDVVRFGGKANAVAVVFGQLTRGLAALAISPGGVTFAGQHWCADHGMCEQAAQDAARRVGEAA